MGAANRLSRPPCTTRRRARPAGRGGALEWAGEPDRRAQVAALPFGDELAGLRARCSSRAEFARRVPDAWVAELAVAGTREQARARIAALREAGVTGAVLIPAGKDPSAALASLATVL
ncbi:hypothetical protein [Streptomyces sp. NPDC058330]|uniref:hypothetical protein n=1 Tax=Streptomyces sp. NPDC058330 TaxID=3346449 RepID=UPI0036EF1F18